MKRIGRLFSSIYRRLNRIVDIIGSFFSLPFFLPFHIKKERVSENSSLYLLFPNGFVWLSIYAYFLHVILLAFGVTDADIQNPKLLSAFLVPLSADPSNHFGTIFFVIFFPLILFYTYITQTGQWDKTSLQKHFAEQVPTKEEIQKVAEEQLRQKEERKRILGFFKKWFWRSFIILFGLFVVANFGADGETSWSEILMLSLISASLLTALLTFLSVERLGAKK